MARGRYFNAVSPDGRYLSFVDWNSGGGLTLHDLETGEEHTLTGRADGRGYAEAARFSPDGSQVAYAWINAEGFAPSCR